MKWTDELDNKLRELRLKGETYGEIAKKLNVSRNAAVGRANRINLDPMAKVPTPAPQNLVEVIKQIPEPKVHVPPKKGKIAKNIVDLEPHMCKWPIGSPGEPGFHFCSHTRVESMPYCEGHCKAAYVAPRKTYI